MFFSLILLCLFAVNIISYDDFIDTHIEERCMDLDNGSEYFYCDTYLNFDDHHCIVWCVDIPIANETPSTNCKPEKFDEIHCNDRKMIDGEWITSDGTQISELTVLLIMTSLVLLFSILGVGLLIRISRRQRPVTETITNRRESLETIV